MTMRPGADFLDLAREILRRERDRLAVLLPQPHELLLVGGSSMAGALTKGDVDLHLRVPAWAFAPVVTALSTVHQIVHPEMWQPTLATFTVDAPLPTGIAVTPAGSTHDVRFTRSWRRLAADPALVAAYNEMKLRHQHDPAEYERRKSAFFDRLAAADRPDASTK